MIRAVTVTFDVNDETGEVTNVKTQVEGEVKRRTTTTKKKDVVKELEDVAKITREENKITLNNKAVADIGIEYGDRVFIIYEKDKTTNSLFPVIGRSDETGNKITKSNTIAFKGNQNVALAEFGSEFTIESFKDDMWKLVPLGSSKVVNTMEEAVAIAEQVKPQLLVEDEQDYEIDELEFKL